MSRRTASTGMTLIELMVAMAVGAAILGAATAILVRVAALNATAAEHFSGTVSLTRLGRQFRGDAHAAESASASSDEQQPARLTFELSGDRSIEYEIASGSVQRIVSSNGAPTHRERFVLRGAKALDLRTGGDYNRTVTIVLARVVPVPGHDDVTSSPFEVTAVIPRNGADDQDR